MNPGARVALKSFPAVGLGTVLYGDPVFTDIPRVRVLWDRTSQITEPGIEYLDEVTPA